MSTTANESDPILSGREVQRETGLSRTSIWAGVRKGTFPAPIKVTDQKNGWYQSEIWRWKASRPRVAYAPQAVAA